ncbi:MAG: sulfotransferase family protein [Terriglobia bacterium]
MNVAEMAAYDRSEAAPTGAAAARAKAPVFVIGSPRSGNNFLYHTLLSSGGFAVYRAASQVFNMLVPRFGDFSVLKNRRAMMKAWLASPYFERTGLDAGSIEAKVIAECRSGGDFLRIVMGEICRRQNASRWANLSVEELLYLPEIKRTVPGALFVHTIRDGRDVALSLAKKGYVRPLPWDRDRGLLVAARYWDWIVRRARKLGRALGPDYLEIRYEDLVAHPRETLNVIGEFISQNLDYDRIREAAVGTVGDPNTSFKAGENQAEFNPVGRWRAGYSTEQLASVEALVGPLLHELGYPLETPPGELKSARSYLAFKMIYGLYFDARFWLKSKTPLSRFMVSTASMQSIEVFTL